MSPVSRYSGVGVGEAAVVTLAALGQQCLAFGRGSEQRLVGFVDTSTGRGDQVLAVVAAVRTHDAEDDLGAPARPVRVR